MFFKIEGPDMQTIDFYLPLSYGPKGLVPCGNAKADQEHAYLEGIAILDRAGRVDSLSLYTSGGAWPHKSAEHEPIDMATDHGQQLAQWIEVNCHSAIADAMAEQADDDAGTLADKRHDEATGR